VQLEVSRQDLENHVKRIDDIQTNYKFNNGGLSGAVQPEESHRRSGNKSKGRFSFPTESLDNEVIEPEIEPETELVNSPQTGAGSALPDSLQADQLQLAKLMSAQPNVSRPNDLHSSKGSGDRPGSSALNSLAQLIALMKSNPMYQYQCWCKAYGQHQTISSRKAHVQLSCE
jgi:hypothetical protein